MHRKWMIANRLSLEYWNGVEKFIKFAIEHADNYNRIKCMYIRCACVDKFTIKVLRNHFSINEIDQGYTRCVWHGENAREDTPLFLDKRRSCDRKEEVNCNEGAKLGDMVHDIKENFMDRLKILNSLKNDAETPFYVGCSKFIRLSTMLRLYNLKTKNNSYLVVISVSSAPYPLPHRGDDSYSVSRHIIEIPLVSFFINCNLSQDILLILVYFIFSYLLINKIHVY